MRGCVVSLLLLLLLAANGYCLWQIGRLRAEVGALQQQVAAWQEPRPKTALEAAEAALEAVRRGDWGRAREELDSLSRRIDGMRTLAAREKRELRARVARVREALAKPGGEAAKRLQAILHDLSPHKRPENDTES